MGTTWRSARGVVAIAIATFSPCPSRAGPASPPVHLSETGLYSEPATHRVDERNLRYSPQYPLWSDGAVKRRWIFLPPGKTIDTSDPDLWDFPVGTKVWKEFAFGRRVETRYMEKVSAERWNVATYVWNDDETDAVRAPDEGIRNHAEIVPGKRHDIPGVGDCASCHEGRRIQVLGFSALQLSRDRDPGAPHAEASTPDMVDLTTLVERKLVSSPPRDWVSRPPRIAAANPTERARPRVPARELRLLPRPLDLAGLDRPPASPAGLAGRPPGSGRRPRPSGSRASSSSPAMRRRRRPGSSRGTPGGAPSCSAWQRAIRCGRCRRSAPRSSTRRAST